MRVESDIKNFKLPKDVILEVLGDWDIIMKGIQCFLGGKKREPQNTQFQGSPGIIYEKQRISLS